jgi:hypothetical protein
MDNMISLRSRRIIILLFIGSLILLMVLGMVYFVFPRDARQAVHLIPTPMATPGLVVYGNVEDSLGNGIAGVEIYRRYASYPGVVIATSGADGYYESAFAHIPGDEMVTIWANKTGMTFVPMHYYWRHYYGYEQRECNFTQRTWWESYLPLISGKSEK